MLLRGVGSGVALSCGGRVPTPPTLEVKPDKNRPISVPEFLAVTRPTARVLALLEILQAGGIRTVGELAGRLGVDERTVRRYVVHLIDLDIPVESVRGRYGGYRLAPGYRMPPLMLTGEEALAVLLGLVAGRRTGAVTTSVAAAESAAAKLRRVLPKALGGRLDALLQTVEFTAEVRSVATPETDVLLLLAEAARDRRPVAVAYTGRDGQRSERTVHAYGIVAHAGRWYVMGADSASGEVRVFRLDRISTPTVLAGSFDVPDGFDPAARVLSALAEMPYQHEVSVLVQGTVDQVRPLLPAALATVQEVTSTHDIPAGPAQTGAAQWVRVRIRAERLDWIPAVLAGLDRPLIIEHPDALRVLVRALAQRLVADTTNPP